MSGFANTAPQGRAMRMDKDTLEKDMLRQRTGGFQKHEVYDGPITVPEADGLGYAGDADRFQTDAASADAEVRGGDMARKDQMYADRRMKRAGVEEERWSKIEAEKKVEDSKWDMKHQQGINGKKNNSSVHYDVMTTYAKDTPEGDALRAKDDGVTRRADARADRLASSSSGGINPITGELMPSSYGRR